MCLLTYILWVSNFGMSGVPRPCKILTILTYLLSNPFISKDQWKTYTVGYIPVPLHQQNKITTILTTENKTYDTHIKPTSSTSSYLINLNVQIQLISMEYSLLSSVTFGNVNNTMRLFRFWLYVLLSTCLTIENKNLKPGSSWRRSNTRFHFKEQETRHGSLLPERLSALL